jgi:hypothetical protein
MWVNFASRLTTPLGPIRHHRGWARGAIAGEPKKAEARGVLDIGWPSEDVCRKHENFKLLTPKLVSEAFNRAHIHAAASYFQPEMLTNIC